MKKKLTAMVLALGAALGARADIGGSGTAASPYEIAALAVLVGGESKSA